MMNDSVSFDALDTMDIMDTMPGDKGEPLISVIVPVYNAGKYLEKCIGSVLGQSYEHLELILVNDGSTDGSGELCGSYAERDGRVRLIDQGHQGVSSARNTGLAAARGEYIAFVDSDDWIEAEMLAMLRFLLEDAGADMAVCACYEERADGGQSLIDVGLEENVIDGRGALERVVHGCLPFIALWNKLYRRSLFKGFAFPPGRIHEDVFAAHELAFRCRKVACLPDALYHYVRHVGSISTTTDMHYLDTVAAYCGRYRFLREQGFSEWRRITYHAFSLTYGFARKEFFAGNREEEDYLHSIDVMAGELLRERQEERKTERGSDNDSVCASSPALHKLPFEKTRLPDAMMLWKRTEAYYQERPDAELQELADDTRIIMALLPTSSPERELVMGSGLYGRVKNLVEDLSYCLSHPPASGC